MSNETIGGPQGPKALLDRVLAAVTLNDVATLRELKQPFLSIEENVAKCLDSSGNTLVHLSLGKDTATLKFVVEEFGADINVQNLFGRTPLHECVRNNFLTCCAYLLEQGADDSVSSSTLSTPFHTAAACGSLECLELLLKHSKNANQKVNEVDKNKCTALHKCAYDGDLRVTQWLLDHGASVDAKDHHETTPLLVAVKMGREDVVEMLLGKGADFNQRDGKGNRAVHYCASRCLPRILERLVKAGATVAVQNDEFNNPLHLAGLNQRADSNEWEQLVVDLVRYGCDLKQENAAGKIPEALVGRALKPLFSQDEVKRRQEIDAAKSRSQTEKQKSDQELRAQLIAERRAQLQAKELKVKEEEERRHREAEERNRAEDDARTRVEELLEQKRQEEEEAKRAKAKAAKGK
jgi:ankyrin repeat protein